MRLACIFVFALYWEYAHKLAVVSKFLPLDAIQLLVNWNREAPPARLSRESPCNNVVVEVRRQFSEMMAIRNSSSTKK
jgi:hypothetical protein